MQRYLFGNRRGRVLGMQLKKRKTLELSLDHTENREGLGEEDGEKKRNTENLVGLVSLTYWFRLGGGSWAWAGLLLCCGKGSCRPKYLIASIMCFI